MNGLDALDGRILITLAYDHGTRHIFGRMEGILGLLDEFWRTARSLASGQSITTEQGTLPVLLIEIYNGIYSWL